MLMLCVEIDVEDARCVGSRLIALNEYMDVSAGIHIDVLGCGLDVFEALGRAAFGSARQLFLPLIADD